MVLVLIAFLSAVPPATAQETRGSIYGSVTDAHGASVPGAEVVIVHTETGVATRITANGVGYFEAPLLISGPYEITVSQSGFKKAVNSGLVLAMGGALQANVQLQVGEVSESVTVSAEAPLLDTSTVSSGRTLDTKMVEDLPVIWGNPIMLLKSMAGVQSPTNQGIAPHGFSGASDAFTAPGGVGNKGYSLDGVANVGYQGGFIAFMPLADSIAEMRLETGNFDASYGHTANAGVSMMTKAGTNAYHGSATWRHSQDRWNAIPFFTAQTNDRKIIAANQSGNLAEAARLRSQNPVLSGHKNQWVGTFGGPVRIPKLYNGANRLFFFFSYEGFKQMVSEADDQMLRTVPTALNRKGNFSDLASIGTQYIIYDPLTVQPDAARAGHYIRTPFAGNLIPLSRQVNPAAKYYDKFIPLPNIGIPAGKDPVNNYLAKSPFNPDYFALMNRVDYTLNDKHRVFFRWAFSDYVEERLDWTYETVPGINGMVQTRNSKNGVIDWVWVASGRTAFNFSNSATQYGINPQSSQLASTQYKPSDFGFPKYMDDLAGDHHAMPRIDLGFNAFTNSAGLYSPLGNNGYRGQDYYRVFNQKASLTHIRNAHSIRAGLDTQQYFNNGKEQENLSGLFTFRNNYTKRCDDACTGGAASNIGHPWAAWLLGMPVSAQLSPLDSRAMASRYYSWFLQDTLRIGRNLTLNLGLRWEYETGPTERFNRMIVGFDPTIALPISAAAEAAYAASPVTERTRAFLARGGTSYAGVNGGSRQLFDGQLMWLPRLGLAYQFSPRTVLRLGYGWFYESRNAQMYSPSQPGYSQSTVTNATNDFGLTWNSGDPYHGVATMTDPFPLLANGSRVTAPLGNALGVMAQVGGAASLPLTDGRHQRTQHARIGLQRQIGSTMSVEASYEYKYNDDLYVTKDLDPVPANYWVYMNVRAQANYSNLTQQVTNPYYIGNFGALKTSNPALYDWLSAQSLTQSKTIGKDRLLRGFSQYSSVSTTQSPLGWQHNHQVIVTFQKQFHKGFNLNASYMYARSDLANRYFNAVDSDLCVLRNSAVRPHRVTASGVYSLPFGKGRRFAQSRLASTIFGGYQVALTYEFMSGAQLEWGNNFFSGDLNNIAIDNPTPGRWFNTDAGFEKDPNKAPLSYQYRTFPVLVPWLRGDISNWWNGDVQREFKVKEKYGIQLRANVLNIMNRTAWGNPSLTPSSTNFGVVTSVNGSAVKRQFELQLRLKF